MAHCKVLFVGTTDNLRQIYADCPDSSSECGAEMAFGYDYLYVYPKDILLREIIISFSAPEYSDCEFTIKDKELYNKYIIMRKYSDCFDIRDNTSNHYINSLSNEEIDKFFNTLPDNTCFFVCEGHL